MSYYSSQPDAMYEEPEMDSLFDSDESMYDSDEGLDDNFLRRGLNFRPVRPVLGGRMPTTPPRPYSRPGVISTPAGNAEVKLPTDLVDMAKFRELEQKVLQNNKAILVNSNAIGALNSNTKKMEVAIGRQTRAIANIGKQIDGLKQGQMFAAILPPKIQEINFTAAPGAGSNKVESTKVDMLTSLLPMMVSGGFGGSTTSTGTNSNNNMMLPLLLLATRDGGLSGTGGNNDSTLILVMAMMMMNK